MPFFAFLDMAIETERKFLVKDTAFLSKPHESYAIAQAYFCHEKGKTVRVRLCRGKGILTLKGPVMSDGLSRFEWEKELTEEEALLLLSTCKEGKIEKERHLIPGSGQLTWEVDVFHGENEGLIVAEIELPDAVTPFDRPDWLGEEVSGDARYYNSNLILTPYSLWK